MVKYKNDKTMEKVLSNGVLWILRLSLIFMRKYPSYSKDLCSHVHNFVKFMPIDKER